MKNNYKKVCNIKTCVVYLSCATKHERLKTKIMNTFTIKTTNNGTLFYVCDEYNMYGNYYKTLKGAEKKLKQVLFSCGIN